MHKARVELWLAHADAVRAALAPEVADTAGGAIVRLGGVDTVVLEIEAGALGNLRAALVGSVRLADAAARAMDACATMDR